MSKILYRVIIWDEDVKDRFIELMSVDPEKMYVRDEAWDPNWHGWCEFTDEDVSLITIAFGNTVRLLHSEDEHVRR